jgi:hypothetical protein
MVDPFVCETLVRIKKVFPGIRTDEENEKATLLRATRGKTSGLIPDSRVLFPRIRTNEERKRASGF